MLLLQSKKIGIIDSGVGGLTVARQVPLVLGQEIIYCADTKHLPYGNKTPAQIYAAVHAIVHAFSNYGVDTIVLACHTASAIALSALRTEFPNITFVGVLEQVVAQAVRVTRNGNIGVMATVATITAGAHRTALHAHNSSFNVIEQPCPLLVSAIEQQDYAAIECLLPTYLQAACVADIDTLVLACTHYPIVQEQIQQVVGAHVQLIGAQLWQNNSESLCAHTNVQFFVTGDAVSFERNVYALFGWSVRAAQLSDLEK